MSGGGSTCCATATGAASTAPRATTSRRGSLSDGPAFKRRWVSEETCAVAGADRPALSPSGAADAGSCATPTASAGETSKRRASPSSASSLEGPSSPEPRRLRRRILLPDRRSQAECGSASLHDSLWHEAGRPRGAAFEGWAARVRQPANRRVLSLRGLPELVRLELLYAIGCRANEQVRDGTGDMRRYVDQLLASGVGSVLEFDLAASTRAATGTTAASPASPSTGSASPMAMPRASATESVWDLRLSAAPGRLDFSRDPPALAARSGQSVGGRQLWPNRNHQLVRTRVHAVAVLSSMLAAGPGGGQDPAALSPSRRRPVPHPGALGASPRRAASPTVPTAQRPSSRTAPSCCATPGTWACSALWRRPSPSAVAMPAAAVPEDEPGRALPAHVVAQLDAQLELLRAVPGLERRPGASTASACSASAPGRWRCSPTGC